MTAPRQIKLGMFLRPAAHHIAGWRHKDAWADGGLNFAKYVETAKAAERGLFDLLFSADALTGERYDRETLSRTTYVAWIDPMSLLTALAPVTQNIGLVCTSTTTYDEPYHIARRFASLDLISGGRSGWNLVTSANDAEAKNFGREDHMPKEVRYRRAREFVEVVRGLWDSLGRRRLRVRQGGRPLLRPRPPPRARSRRRVLQGAGAAHGLALAAGPAGGGAGRRVGRRPATGGGDRRGGVLRASVDRRCAAILSRREGAHGALRPRPGSSQGHARPRRHGRADAAGGRGQVPGAAGPHPSRGRRRAAVEISVLRSDRLRHRRPGAGGRSRAASRRARSS